MPAEPFNISSDGMHPEAGYAYRYDDGKDVFWFYVNIDDNGEERGSYTLVFKHMTIGRFSGRPPSISESELRIVEENITGYFSRYTLFNTEFRAFDKKPALRFDWAFSANHPE
jgi:hypothetical protein